MRRVFVAHPLKGNIMGNIERARILCREISERYADIVPLCPILMFPAFLDDCVPEERMLSQTYYDELLKSCDEIWMPMGWEHSEGCSHERSLAKSLGKPVRYILKHRVRMRIWPPRKKPDRIICLIGESGSGKTTIAQALEDLGYNVIQSYTTRAPRQPNEWGHIFETMGEFKRTPARDIIADTTFSGHYYWATRHQYQGYGDTIYVIDPIGVDALKSRVKDATILAIYLQVDEVNRIARMQNRTLEEIGQRIHHDRERFSIAACDYIVDCNRPIDKVLEAIYTIIISRKE